MNKKQRLMRLKMVNANQRRRNLENKSYKPMKGTIIIKGIDADGIERSLNLNCVSFKINFDRPPLKRDGDLFFGNHQETFRASFEVENLNTEHLRKEMSEWEQS